MSANYKAGCHAYYYEQCDDGVECEDVCCTHCLFNFAEEVGELFFHFLHVAYGLLQF